MMFIRHRLLFFMLLACGNAHAMLTKLPPQCPRTCIVPFDTRYTEKVKKIARSNVYKLSSVSLGEHNATAYEKLLHEDIMPIFSDKNAYAKVYLYKEEPIGFITYTLYEPLYARIFTTHSHATINHLAIEEGFQGKGYGSQLLQAALQDCKQQSVSRVALWVTAQGAFDDNMHKLYTKFGFSMVRQTKLYERQYALRLAPYPLLGIIKKLLDSK